MNNGQLIIDNGSLTVGEASARYQSAIVNSPLVPSGYKQTEAGVIPEDWDVKPLMDLANEISDGIHATPKYVRGSDFFFVNGNNLINDEIMVTSSTMCVSEAEYKSLKKPLTDRTILFSINGTIGNLAFYNGEKVVLGKSAAFINIAKDISKEFIAYCLKSRPTVLFFENELTGTTIRNLSLQSLRNTPIPCPPTIDEQRAIAAALSDVDALLAKLDQLIAKKRDLKQAAMQQLLTGQIRLPGFNGAWELKRIGDFTDCTAGGTPSTAVSAYWGGSIRWMNSGELNLKKVNEVEGRITEHGLKNSSSKIIPAYCVLVGLAGQGKTRGTVAMNTVELCINQSIAAIYPNQTFNSDYLYYYLDSQYEELRSLSTGDGGRGGLNLTIIRSVMVPFPKIKEQTAIAAILSDMDAEITALEARRDKTKDLKQGMMQELLTGRIRLV